MFTPWMKVVALITVIAATGAEIYSPFEFDREKKSMKLSLGSLSGDDKTANDEKTLISLSDSDEYALDEYGLDDYDLLFESNEIVEHSKSRNNSSFDYSLFNQDNSITRYKTDRLIHVSAISSHEEKQIRNPLLTTVGNYSFLNNSKVLESHGSVNSDSSVASINTVDNINTVKSVKTATVANNKSNIQLTVARQTKLLLQPLSKTDIANTKKMANIKSNELKTNNKETLISSNTSERVSDNSYLYNTKAIANTYNINTKTSLPKPKPIVIVNKSKPAVTITSSIQIIPNYIKHLDTEDIAKLQSQYQQTLRVINNEQKLEEYLTKHFPQLVDRKS